MTPYELAGRINSLSPLLDASPAPGQLVAAVRVTVGVEVTEGRFAPDHFLRHLVCARLANAAAMIRNEVASDATLRS